MKNISGLSGKNRSPNHAIKLSTGRNSSRQYHASLVRPDLHADAFGALINGEIEVLPADRKVATQMFERNFLKDKHKIGIISGFEKTNRLYLVMPSKGPRNKPGRCDIDFLARFNAALKAIDENGILDSIKNRYQRHFENNRLIQLMAAPGYPLITGVAEEYHDADIMGKETPKFLIPQGTPRCRGRVERPFSPCRSVHTIKRLKR